MAAISGRSRSNLTTRLLSAVIGLPLLTLVIWAGGITIAVVATIAGLIAAHELLTLFRQAGWRPLHWPGLVWAAAIAAAAPFDLAVVLLTLAIGAGLLLIAAAAIRRSAEFVGDAVFTAVPAVYGALPLAAVVLLRDEAAGLQWLIVAFAATFATDTGAYAVGKLMGRHKMAPSISPGKTWEGAAGGLLAAIGATIGLVALLGDIANAYVAALALGLAIGVISMAGDLLESKLKRLAGVKDSGVLIPGHGGIMDRLDSLVLVFPLVYYAAKVWPTF